MTYRSLLTLLAALTITVSSPSVSHAVDNDMDTFDSSIDCNDNNPAINPGATEIAGDAVDADENCDSLVTCFQNNDGDGYRTNAVITSSDADCSDAGEARASLSAGDCNDSNPAINPGATEVAGDPGNTDENCDGIVRCYRDLDEDGARTSTQFNSSDSDCSDVGEAFAADPCCDCDDTNGSIGVGSPEVAGDAGDVDEDCDGDIGCFVNQDDDPYRTTNVVNSTDLDCDDSGEDRASDPTGDCDDTNAAINPGATEVCDDTLDNNCNLATDCADASCSAAPVCTATTTTTLPPTVLDHYKCYKVKDASTTKFGGQPGIDLNDELANDTVDVVKPAFLCAPADKEGSGIANPDAFLCCYKIKGTKLVPPVPREITDQFGTLTLEASKPKVMCQPCTAEDVP